MNNHYPHRLYFVSMSLVYLIYALVFIGLLSTVPEYIYTFIFFIQLALCLFLMFFYNPFRSHYTLDKYDAQLIFGASFLLFINLISVTTLNLYWPDFISRSLNVLKK